MAAAGPLARPADRVPGLPRRRWLPERLGGVVLLLLVASTAGGSVWALLAYTVLFCYPWANLAAATLLIYFGWPCQLLPPKIGLRAGSVRQGRLARTRRRLSRIVGRDTAALSPTEIYRACVETVAENTTDAVVGPLLFTALFGPIGLWIFKAISTLDSMVGHRNERYLRFGWALARADDLANLVPVRLTWLLMVLAALLTDSTAAARRGSAARRPQASQPEFGVVRGRRWPGAWVRLGGASSYQGKPGVKPTLGDGERPLEAATVRRAIRLTLATSWLTVAVCILAQTGEIVGYWQ